MRLVAMLLPFLIAACGGGGSADPCQPLSRVGADTHQCLNPHPPNWANAVGQEGFHGTAALQAPTCGACHDRGASELCVACHGSAGPGLVGIGGDLHTASFVATHSRADIAGNATTVVSGGVPIPCLGCHRG